MKRRHVAFVAGLLVMLLTLVLASTSCGTAKRSVSMSVAKPVEIARFYHGELWQSWIQGDYVVWMQSAGPSGHNGLGYSGSADWDVLLRFVDLRDVTDATAVANNEVHEVPGVRLPAPPASTADGVMLTLPLTWAAVLPGGSGKPFKLVWAAPPTQLSNNYSYHGLSSWMAGAASTKGVRDSSFESISGLASGDALAIPLPVASFDRSNDPADSGSWQKLLMITANMNEPTEVDSKAPRLAAAALAGLSPYFALVDTAVGLGPQIFDLRTGKKLGLDVPSLPEWLPMISGHRAAWYTETGEVYLADLDTGAVRKVLSLPAGPADTISVALGEDWLVALRLTSSSSGTTTTVPSEHPGADLVALHLPDLEEVDLPAVVEQGEVGGVQVSGDLVLLGVSPAIEPIPHNEPPWVSLRVIRLPAR
jgi:hypothetical protein